MAKKSPVEPKWQQFEKIIAEIQRQLAPNAEVRHNHRVIGKSGRKRQLDVTVSDVVGSYPIFIVIECKRYNRPVGIGRLEAFAKKLENVGANLGVMISTSGFDEGAKAVALDEGILLRTLREAEETDWEDLIGGGAWLQIVRLRYESSTLISFKSGSNTVVGEIPQNEKIYMKNLDMEFSNAIEFTPEIILANFLNWAEPIKQQILKPGTFEIPVENVEQTQSFIWRNENFIKLDTITINVEVIAEKYAVNLRFGEGKILQDAKTDSAIYGEMVSSWIRWKSIFENQAGVRLSQAEYEEFAMERPDTLQVFIDPKEVKDAVRATLVLIPRKVE